MRAVGVYDAKTRFTKLLDDVEQGEVITITRHGKPVAKLVPVEQPRMSVAEAIAGIRANRKGSRLDGLKIKDLINEGRP
jgi:prevent-host-death family protein